MAEVEAHGADLWLGKEVEGRRLGISTLCIRKLPLSEDQLRWARTKSFEQVFFCEQLVHQPRDLVDAMKALPARIYTLSVEVNQTSLAALEQFDLATRSALEVMFRIPAQWHHLVCFCDQLSIWDKEQDWVWTFGYPVRTRREDYEEDQACPFTQSS